MWRASEENEWELTTGDAISYYSEESPFPNFTTIRPHLVLNEYPGNRVGPENQWAHKPPMPRDRKGLPLKGGVLEGLTIAHERWTLAPEDKASASQARNSDLVFSNIVRSMRIPVRGGKEKQQHREMGLIILTTSEERAQDRPDGGYTTKKAHRSKADIAYLFFHEVVPHQKR
jgi:hypothetical protein